MRILNMLYKKKYNPDSLVRRQDWFVRHITKHPENCVSSDNVIIFDKREDSKVERLSKRGKQANKLKVNQFCDSLSRNNA